MTGSRSLSDTRRPESGKGGLMSPSFAYRAASGIRDHPEPPLTDTLGDARGRPALRDDDHPFGSPHAELTDIRMPPGHHMEGIEAAHAIRRDHLGIGVVVLSQHTDEAYAFAVAAGRHRRTCLSAKDRLGVDLIRAVRDVTRSGSVIDPSSSRAWSPDVPGLRGPRSPPSLRAKLDVLREMAQGKTNAGIEQALHLSSSTVEKRVSSIFGKLGLAEEPVHRRVAAVLAFLGHPPE